MKINVAVVGAGYWGPNIIRNLNKISSVKISYVCDLLENNLKKIHSVYPFIVCVRDINVILDDAAVDLVIIATPLETHFELAKKILLSKKHVMLEKPMTRTLKQAIELNKIAKKMKKIIFVGHTFVYNNAVKKIKDVLKKKQLGKVYYYNSIRANLGLIQKNSNVVWDLAPHDFSILQYIFSEKPLSIQVFGSKFVHKTQEEDAYVFIRFENNITAHFHLSWLSPVKIRTIMIGGAKRMVVYDELNPSEKIRIFDKGVKIKQTSNNSFLSHYRYGDILTPFIQESEALYNELCHFIKCVQENKLPITGGEEGMQVVKLLEAADKSLRENKEIIL